MQSALITLIRYCTMGCIKTSYNLAVATNLQRTWYDSTGPLLAAQATSIEFLVITLATGSPGGIGSESIKQERMQINDYYICHLLTVKGATNDSLEISNINATFSVGTLIVSKHLYAIVVIKYKFN